MKKLSLLNVIEITMLIGALIGYFSVSASMRSQHVIQFDSFPPNDDSAVEWIENNSRLREVKILRDKRLLVVTGSMSWWSWANGARPEPPWEELGYVNPQYRGFSGRMKYPVWPAVAIVLFLIAMRIFAYSYRGRGEQTAGQTEN